MRSRFVLLSVLAAIALAPAAWAQTEVSATTLVETTDAVFFSKQEQPSAVYYFAKTQTVLEEFSVPGGAYRRFRVQEKLRTLKLPLDLGTLHPSWAGRTALPFTLTPSQSCTLNTKPEMLLVARQADMKDRAIAGNTLVALCQFSFNLRNDIGDAYVEQLQEDAAAGNLLNAPLPLTVIVSGTLRWSDLHAEIERGAQELAENPMSRDDALVLIGWALSRTPSGAASYLQLSETARDQFVETALAKLFSKPTFDTYVLAEVAQDGEFPGWIVTRTIEL
ncbi:hypothetical protein JQX13_22005 [Archangium violaceum]|uniref:hypothetical protein n=1 Tax=Archangium violaceum TaxID=83451 RepID=UPI00193B331B|nr:hypothetical protein [Archangium violaceum]QRK12460.1 hypothetical protein JQX13_22005 [Archangium violaceum]